MIDRSSAGLGRRIALVVGALATVPAMYAADGFLLAAAGYATFASGALTGSRRLLVVGAGALFVGVVAGTMGRTAPLLPLLGTAAVVVAWDVGEHSIGLGEQVGRDAPTGRAELVHAAASGAVGLAGTVAGMAIYRLAWAGQPPAALVLFLAGGALLILALRGSSVAPRG